LSLHDPYRYHPPDAWAHLKSSYPRGIEYEDIKGLNLGPLEELVLDSISSKEAEMLMDLALQSTREKITLHIENLEDLEELHLNHDLVNRTSELFLSSREFYGALIGPN
jgi:hypothetical protein